MKKWKCTVCGYVHEGAEPPEECPVCGAPKSAFVEDTGGEKGDVAPPSSPSPAVAQGASGTESKTSAAAAAPSAGPAGPATAPAAPSAAPVVPLDPSADDIKTGLYAISYGMFVVSSRKGDKFNAQTCNTVFQVTSDPPRIAVGINKLNLTREYIEDSGTLVVTVLGKGNMKHVKRFGFQSGRSVDKFQGLEVSISPKVGCPIIPDGVAYLECRVRREMSTDVGTHTLYVADVVGGGALRGSETMTYASYRQNRAKPEAMVDDVDWNNVVAALNLEFGADRRYQYQISQLSHPRLTSILEGVMRTEGDHVDSAVKYLNDRLAEKLGKPEAKGMLSALLFMKLNQEFEEVAQATYSQFAKETDDPALKDLFKEQARSEFGHVNIFKEAVVSLEKGEYPVMFFCPVCGWELDYGARPNEGDVKGCPKCGARFALMLEGGDWKLNRV